LDPMALQRKINKFIWCNDFLLTPQFILQTFLYIGVHIVHIGSGIIS
jgi:hypothetical protein